jgi:hypothetical protein
VFLPFHTHTPKEEGCEGEKEFPLEPLYCGAMERRRWNIVYVTSSFINFLSLQGGEGICIQAISLSRQKRPFLINIFILFLPLSKRGSKGFLEPIPLMRMSCIV